MEKQLKTFRTLAGEPYRLLALPMADKIEEDGERLPATYRQFPDYERRYSLPDIQSAGE